MKTGGWKRNRAHNATIEAVKARFSETTLAARVRGLLARHSEMLQVLLEREGVRVY